MHTAHCTLAGAYIGFEVSRMTGSWVLAFPVAFIAMALLGVILQVFVFRHLDGQDLQQTLITIGISIVLADLMLWRWGGEFLSNIRAGLAEWSNRNIYSIIN